MADPGSARRSARVGAARLERRCRQLLRAYPEDYRARRGEELVATMIEVTGPGRSTPHLADAIDLVASGVRQRVGAATPAGLPSGLAVAAPVAVAIAAGVSLFAWWQVEPIGNRTVGPIGYAGWLLAAVGWLLPRPGPRRVLLAAAIGLTWLLPVLARVAGLDRPPLWVLMALSAFGLLGLAGSAPRTRGASNAVSAANAVGAPEDDGARPSLDERLAVPAGAVAVACCASAVTTMWPASSGVGYYYQPTIARVGLVVAITMAALAVLSVVRLVRGGNAQPWLWATVLLGLPAGWLGPFDSAGLRLAADREVPQFGRLAQVLLASSVAMIAMAWLARRRPAGDVARRRAVDAVRTAAFAALGSAAGLAVFTAAAGTGWLGFPGQPWRAGIPRHVVATLVALVLAGLCGLAGRAERPDRAERPGPARRADGADRGDGADGADRARSRVPRWGLVVGFASALGCGWVVGAYDNDWRAGGWTDFSHTSSLTMTLAFVPFTYGAIMAARVLPRSARTGSRAPAAGLLAVSLGWIGYVALPYLLLWGPVLVIVLAGAAVFALSSRRGASSAMLPR